MTDGKMLENIQVVEKIFSKKFHMDSGCPCDFAKMGGMNVEKDGSERRDSGTMARRVCATIRLRRGFDATRGGFNCEQYKNYDNSTNLSFVISVAGSGKITRFACENPNSKEGSQNRTGETPVLLQEGKIKPESPSSGRKLNWIKLN